MSRNNPIWRDIVSARPGMSEDEARDAGRKLGYVRVSMLRRCNNPDDKDYANYGGRGISVCGEWADPVNGLRDFAVWAVQSGWAPGLTIDRKDNDKGYSPDNCRWATRIEQAYNRTTNRSVTLDVPVQVLQRVLKVNGPRLKELLNGGQATIEAKLVDAVSKDYLSKHRDCKPRLYRGCCPCCGESTTDVYRRKAKNGKWVVIGCNHCVQAIDTYAAAVEAGVFDVKY